MIALLLLVEIRRSRIHPKEGVLITADGLEGICRQSFIALHDRCSLDIPSYNTTMSISHFPLLDLYCGFAATIMSLNCVTSALSFGPGLFRKGFACSTRISSASVPSALIVPWMNSLSGIARGSSLLLRRSVCTHGGAISRTLTEVALSL